MPIQKPVFYNNPNVTIEKPVLVVEDTDSQFTDSNVLVNDTIVTVNSSSQYVGGSDLNNWKPDIYFGGISNIKPILRDRKCLLV